MAHQLMNKDTMMSVRETPWHKLGAVLDDYPTSIDDALVKSGLGWQVGQGSVLVCEDEGDPLTTLRRAEMIARQYERDGTIPTPEQLESLLAAVNHTPVVQLAQEFRGNLRADDKALLGIVSDDYKVVQNEQAFRFLDALIGSDLHFETAGSLMNGKKVWVLARLPEWIEIGGDDTAIFVYVANAHDGSMAVTSGTTGVRIVCANTLAWALRQSEYRAERVYKFRHTGDLAIKFDEARKVMGMTLNYAKQFKALGDQLALEPFSANRLGTVMDKLVPIDRDSMTTRMINNRQRIHGKVIDLYCGRGEAGDTRGNSPGTKWTAVNAIGEWADWDRRYTKTTDQMRRSFEDTDLKQRGLELVLAA